MDHWLLQFLVMAWTTDIHMAFSISTDHRSHHGLWWQCRPQIWTLPSAKAWTTESIVALGGSRGHGHQHGSSQRWRSAWLQAAAQTMDIHMAFVISTCEPQHGPWWQRRPWTLNKTPESQGSNSVLRSDMEMAKVGKEKELSHSQHLPNHVCCQDVEEEEWTRIKASQ